MAWSGDKKGVGKLRQQLWRGVGASQLAPPSTPTASSLGPPKPLWASPATYKPAWGWAWRFGSQEALHGTLSTSTLPPPNTSFQENGEGLRGTDHLSFKCFAIFLEM